MIRDYKLEDKGKIIEILQSGLTLDMSYINNNFTNKNRKAMVYEGWLKEESYIKFVNYEDKYYEDYIKVLADVFYELRVANDIKPYICYPISDEDRENVLRNKDNIYLSLSGDGEIISTVNINGGYIDELVVNKNYKGRGIGKETIKFAINKCIKSGVDTISLEVVEWNNKAFHIYKNHGFKVVKKINFERQFMEREL